MAFVMVVVGYVAYRLLAHGSTATSLRRAVAAGAGAYVGLNAAALATAIEFGIQPTLFHTANGTPLYAPFHLSQTIPAMALAHLTVAGAVEVLLTFGIVRFVQRTQPQLLDERRAPSRPWNWRPVALIFGGAVLLTPLGLLATGTPFGEDAPASARLWHRALLDGYGFTNGAHSTVGYIVSAIVGLAAIVAVVVASGWIAGRVRRRMVVS
jgi:cobalt/nickel transport system permease protein